MATAEEKFVKDKSEDMEDDLLEYTKILLEDMDDLEKPKGLRKDQPGISCKNIHLLHPNLPSGYYWIDPNEGFHHDAIRVWCNMTIGSTCVESTLKKFKKSKWSSGENDESIPYAADQTQLAFLQMLSSTASQNLTYHCRNSHATKRELRLLGVNEFEFQLTGEGREELKHKITKNECQANDGVWRKTVFEITSEKTVQLPIVDFYTKHAAGPSEEFGIDVGPVCFS